MKWIIVLILILLISCTTTPENILELNLKEHSNLQLHDHVILKIEILGNVQNIPANIGISDNGMRVIHTHDETGKLHIESPYTYQFFLEDFFTIWGKNFNQTCILTYCNNENNSVKVYVNDVLVEEKKVPLIDDSIIKIIYSAN